MTDAHNIPRSHGRSDAALDIVPVAGRIGAEFRGLDLSIALEDETITRIRQALLAHKVIFFREQHMLDDKGMEALTERLGDPIPHPNAGLAEGSRFLLDLEADSGYFASIWHTDMTFIEAYPELSILRPIVLPPAGGDTMWANCAAAYNALPTPLKRLAESLRALHSNETDYYELLQDRQLEWLGKHRGERPKRAYLTEHPVVRVHEETGERALLLGESFVKTFVGCNVKQSQHLLALFQEFITAPENTVRWKWRLGDVAIWDNRATQHRSVADFGDEQRQLRRSTVHGTVPVGVDGQPSKPIGFGNNP